MFSCPRCEQGLFRQTLSGQAHWVCPGCGGHALNFAVLRNRVLPEAAHEIWRASNDGFPSILPCPSCRKNMLIAPLHLSGGQMNIEVCRVCHFVWFDAEELRSLPPRPAPSSADPSLPQNAREALAILEVQKMAERQREESYGDAPDEGWKQALGWFGMPVECEAQPLTRTPWATWILSAIIVVFASIAFLQPESIARLGFVPADPFRHFGLTLLTSFLLHGGILHLISNIYFLLAFGDNVEDLLGPGRFLGLVGASALAGDALHWVFGPGSTVPAVGASGGISGIIAFYALAFPKAQLAIVVRWRWVRFTAMWGFVLWIGVQLFVVYLQSEGLSRVAGTAHLGGALVGVAYCLAFKPRLPAKPLLG